MRKAAMRNELTMSPAPKPPIKAPRVVAEVRICERSDQTVSERRLPKWRGLRTSFSEFLSVVRPRSTAMSR